MRCVAVGTLLAVAAIGAGSGRLQAADGLASQIAQMFKLAADHSSQSSATLERHYRGIRSDEHAATVDYAYALVLIERHQLREAEAVLNEIRGGDDLAVVQTKIWVELALSHRQQALWDLKLLVEQLSQPNSEQGDSAAYSAAGFLGRVVGYLRGPGIGKLPAEDLEALRTQIRQGLAKPLHAVVEAGEAETADRFAELQAQHTAALHEAKAEAAQTLANAEQEHAAKKKSLADERQKLDSKLAKRRAKAAADIRELDGKLVQAVPKLALLYQSIGMLQLAQQALTTEFQPENIKGTYLAWNVGGTPPIAARWYPGGPVKKWNSWNGGDVFVPGKSPGQPVSSYGISPSYFTPQQWGSNVVTQPQYLGPINHLMMPPNVVLGQSGYARSDAAVNHNQGVEAALLAVNTPMRLLGLQAAPLQVNVNALFVRRADTVGRQMHGLARASERSAELDRQAKVLERSARQARADARQHLGQVRAHAGDLTALKTYVEIPLEREKQRVLANLEAP